MDYKSYLNSLPSFEHSHPTKTKVKFSLVRMKKILALLGNPQKNFISIHVVGTKGKGSVSVMIASILKEAGFKTGLYTSPHFFSIKERIKINHQNISDENLDVCLKKIKNIWDKNFIERFGELTYFEALTIAMFLHFSSRKIDFAVIEAGLGGRLDATRLARGKYCVITKIGKDHTQILGNTIFKIAKEKAGILEREQSVFSSIQEPEAKRAILSVVRKKNVKCVFVAPGDNKLARLVPLMGEHQIENASLAIGVSQEILNKRLTKEFLRRVFEKMKWPGRFDIICRRPLVVLDVAHNAMSLDVLEKTFFQNFPHKKYSLIFGANSDKDFSDYNGKLFKKAKRVVLTTTSNPRSYTLDCLEKHLSAKFGINKEVSSIQKPCKAWEFVLKETKDDEAIIVTGSFYLVAKIMKIVSLRNAK